LWIHPYFVNRRITYSGFVEPIEKPFYDPNKPCFEFIVIEIEFEARISFVIHEGWMFFGVREDYLTPLSASQHLSPSNLANAGRFITCQ
jgi:hypothetical protein